MILLPPLEVHKCLKPFRCVHKIAKRDYKLRQVSPSVRLSACNNSPHTGRILMEFDILSIFLNLPRKLKFY